ncbi:hypothetical protein SARC_04306 [Sphaeroforma arctica JP610]|uniref:Uncharacterized protein n=1 Tax=Sphaeroforma arctica JP610 TaxID=667725 RepID=A0A0L0G3M5_9EUKA|nr:hypothetical protein SARC_04306 [Sphaeroforma arctica JP610]KNC83441.1 hypothetical protein SARC_04306 [Sphaeroforma arctica JP610]|eukprot:XP_014157343.1 hypothetical protein SARC_04306 [Sphaeroforma arctica JP610]
MLKFKTLATFITVAATVMAQGGMQPAEQPVVQPIVADPSPTAVPVAPILGSDYITCAVKDVESPLGCAVVQDDKECCRYSSNCNGLNKCTPSYCCTGSAGPVVSDTPPPSPVTSETETITPMPPILDSDYITCAVKDVESPLGCDVLQEDKECCRYSSNCNGLNKCTSSYCCTEAAPETTNTPLPPNLDSDYITCAAKDVESPLGCDVAQDDKVCCRYSSNCNGLRKCTPSYCCKGTATSTPHPEPSSTPSYEPVDNYINCAVKKSEGGFKCSGGEEVDTHKECCRWSKECGDLSKCTESYCCTSDSNYPKPSPSAKPEDFTIKCKEKLGLQCSNGYEMDSNKDCCEYPGACGDLRSCKTDYCCTESGVQIPPDTVGACECDGVVLNQKCYSSLKEAIRAASDGDTIYVGGEIEVDAPIAFEQSLSFSGVLCDNDRAQIIATFDEVDGAIFEAVNEDSQEVNFLHLAITSEGDNSAAAFHSLGSVNGAPDQVVAMSLTNVWIHDMYSQRPGVGIFIGSSNGLSIDDDCVFTDLKMSTSEMDMYAGGAAIAVVYLPKGSEINIAGYFKDNSAFYPDASLHSGGGAIYLDYMEGDVTFTAAFENNSANQGGAVNVQGVLGNMVVDGYFNENKAIDDGYGSRAGAFRVLEIESEGSVLFSGSFVGNTAQGRGGAIATNMHRSGSKMYLDGIFQNNVASTVGGVWSLWTETQMEGQVQLDGDSIFEGNLAVYDDSDSGIYSIVVSGGDTDKLAENEWFGRTITIN